MRTKEKGVTLVALVITIIVLLILASIAYKAGDESIQTAKFTKFQNELKLLQRKADELNLEENVTIGKEITDSQKQKLDSISEITDVIYKDTSDEEKEKIKNSFRKLEPNDIKNDLNIETSKTFFISFEYRYVVYLKGFNYKGQKYYIADQLKDSTYNVRYNNTNDDTGSFDVKTTRENNKWKIEISNINYNGNIGKWEVKYKTKDGSYWSTSYDLTFYITEQGEYTIKVVHGDEVDLGQKTFVLMSDYVDDKGVNLPDLMVGMSAIKFTDPTSNDASGEGTVVKTTSSDSNWYSYTDKKWANAQTEDGSMWVWIPRYAYRINSSTQTTDVVFLIGTSDYYYDESGRLQKAQRQKTIDETIDTTVDFTVHPAFTDESDIGFANGGWDSELTGIWVAKFEAGYASGNNDAPVRASSVKYTQSTAYVCGKEIGSEDKNADARNYLDGVYGGKETFIKYPTFQGLTYSMNYTTHNDAFNILRALTEKNNIYGLDDRRTNSHMMKDSEWGVVAYFSQSRFGLNGQNIYINNVNLNNTTQSVYAVTGMCGDSPDSGEKITTIDEIKNKSISGAYNWKQKNGVYASTTGTIYGIYDMAGGLWERTAGIVLNGNNNLANYGMSLLNNPVDNSKSTKYVTIYQSGENGTSDLNTASKNNYLKNKKIYGGAILESSIDGIGARAWNEDYSLFPCLDTPYMVRGGSLWFGKTAGLFCFVRNSGDSYYSGGGFRSVLVEKINKSPIEKK